MFRQEQRRTSNVLLIQTHLFPTLPQFLQDICSVTLEMKFKRQWLKLLIFLAEETISKDELPNSWKRVTNYNKFWCSQGRWTYFYLAHRKIQTHRNKTWTFFLLFQTFPKQHCRHWPLVLQLRFKHGEMLFELRTAFLEKKAIYAKGVILPKQCSYSWASGVVPMGGMRTRQFRVNQDGVVFLPSRYYWKIGKRMTPESNWHTCRSFCENVVWQKEKKTR